MVHKQKGGKIIEWGFDLTDVTSDREFLSLLGDFRFKEVSTEQLSDDWIYKGRFTKGVTTFANPSGIRITVNYLGGKGSDAGALGYIGIKAPKNAEMELKTFLREFRGQQVEGTDRVGKYGITKYVKQENPYENPYITVG